MNVQQRWTHISTCLHLSVEGVGAIYLAGGAIQSEDVCWLTGWKQWMDMAQFGPGRFLSDTAREDRQEQGRGQNGKVGAGQAGVTWCIVG